MEQRTIAGRYELAEPLGEATWRAVDAELGREVLVRFRPPGPGAALSHPNVRRVFEHGVEEGEPYEVLEYLPGGTLAERGRLAPRDRDALAAALAYAHGRGVTHGAIGADAVLFDAEGNAKLAGFTGAGDPGTDLRALAELADAYVEDEPTLLVPPPAEEATVIRAAPVPPPRRGRGALIAAAAALLVLAGLGAAYLAASDDAAPARTTGTLSVPVPGTTAATDAPTTPAPPTTTEAEGTTTEEATTVATTETQPAAPTPTVAPPPPTQPELPPTTEVPPPLPTTEPPTTEPPPPTAPAEPPPTETGG